MQAPQYHIIAAAIEYILEHFLEQPNLETVAAQVHVSPFHLQRMFTEWAGISPKRFLQYITADYLKQKLQHTPNLQEAASIAGLSAQSRVYDLFVTLEAVTPQQFRTGGESVIIRYGYHNTPFGPAFLAATVKGIVSLGFLEPGQEAQVLAKLHKDWPQAQMVVDDPFTAHLVRQIFSAQRGEKLHVLVKGTNFQVKVWEALLRLPLGSVVTYAKIAEYIGHPKAVRAVGAAVGANPVALLIPCHRVIRKEGVLGEYHWGATRKKLLLGYEMSRADSEEHPLL
ncbi:AraC family transcriptional regulator, regulatory protein of adaptative response / methylated-DNA-[protein]-cysteine methyltransferase [Chitinophaga costaii]|uniref:methylated-DNA--[protein]-cysteine S-methyltransferase n=1 Tax=Chitinophaga costaii TaxID=1335309 RepID=A0A1C4ABM7_9BACT|nr:methylated-DNA--[protein]-cysteine S-methyltransferase [Chitinophaga costaii]PUZ26542.1 methylated-DNA--[protein]-cysteine S-methyltransferase [Chitinophaga costaii]SCB92005.1 AraC family transcriptional regulator, regulatory protein of adaptative response / methylated-DNA-[protein]-cysteine methyltransferase [Chitinophaga costaii]